MKRRHAPQFDLPGMADAFNLAGQHTDDGDRLSRELEQARREREQAEQHQRKHQPQLVTT